MSPAAPTLAARDAHARSGAGSGGTPTRRYPGLHPIRNGRTREEVSSSQRGRLFAATLATVAERGYERSTVSALCHRAGVSKKTLYEHFPTKEALFLATYDLVAYRTLARVRAAREQTSSPERRLRAAFDALASTLAQRPQDARLILVEALAAGRGALARCDRTTRELACILAPALADPLSSDDSDSLLAGALAGGMLWALRLSLWDARRQRRAQGRTPADTESAARDACDAESSQWLETLRDWLVACDLRAPAAAPDSSERGSQRLDDDRVPVRAQERPWGLREALIDAALVVAARSGCEDLTAAQIAERAGCAREQFFTEFADCRECVLAAVHERAHLAARGVAAACAGLGDRRGAARAGMREIAERFTGEPELARVACVEIFTFGRAGVEQLFVTLDALAGSLAGRFSADWYAPRQMQLLSWALVGGGYEVVRVCVMRDAQSFTTQAGFSINRSCDVDKATLG